MGWTTEKLHESLFCQCLAEDRSGNSLCLMGVGGCVSGADLARGVGTSAQQFIIPSSLRVGLGVERHQITAFSQRKGWPTTFAWMSVSSDESESSASSSVFPEINSYRRADDGPDEWMATHKRLCDGGGT